MQKENWECFKKIKSRYKNETEKLAGKLPQLKLLQQELINKHSPVYQVETPLVYNSSLDDINSDSDIRLILVADNPGRREQAAENRRYLVGPSGKIAENFFRNNPFLKIDFRKNVIILNKTPIHTPRTVQLRDLCRLGASDLKEALEESQKLMAALLFEFQQALSSKSNLIPVWITGYSEMKKGGIFEVYTNELKKIYKGPSFKDSVFLFRHFSMNQFTIDLKKQTIPGESLTKTLKRIGTAYREKYLW